MLTKLVVASLWLAFTLSVVGLTLAPEAKAIFPIPKECWHAEVCKANQHPKPPPHKRWHH